MGLEISKGGLILLYTGAFGVYEGKEQWVWFVFFLTSGVSPRQGTAHLCKYISGETFTLSSVQVKGIPSDKSQQTEKENAV